jgi:arylsulfatase
MTDQQNVVLVTLDSVRADHCGFMGYERETTPNLGRIAEDGLRFENAIAPSNSTPPSMLRLFTGDNLPESVGGTDPGTWRDAIRERETLADTFKKRGYTTAAFNPNAYVSSYFGYDKGFDHYQDFIEEGRSGGSIYRRILDRLNQSGKSGPLASIRNMMNLVQREEVFKPWEHFFQDILDWVDSAEEPYFLWILLLDTHHPYLAPRSDREWSSLLEMWRSNFRVTQVMNDETADMSSELSTRDRTDLMDAYDDSIRYADRFLAELQDALAESDPMYAIHADHGEAFGEHGPHGHHTSLLYDTLLHVPLVIDNAGVTGCIEEQFSLADLRSLLLDLADGTVADETDISTSEYVVSEVPSDNSVNVAVRSRRWKYVRTAADGEMLFDLESDPDEQHNVASDHPDLVEELSNLAAVRRNSDSERRLISKSVPVDQL